MKSNKTYDEYLISVVHVESDEVVKMIKVFSTEKAISVRGNLEARYGRDYEVNIASLNAQAVSKGQGMDSESYNKGYFAGERCGMDEVIKIPEDLSKEEKRNFIRGFDNAILDRIS